VSLEHRVLARLHREARVDDARPSIDTWRVLDELIGILEGMVFRSAIDENWTLHLVSDACVNLTGYTAEELLSNRAITYEEVTHPDDRAWVRDAIMEAVREKRPYRIQYRICCKDGTEKMVLDRGACVLDEAGRDVLEGFIEDISAQHAARNGLAAAEARYRSIFENSSEGIFQSTSDGRYLNANPALARIYGYETPAALMAELRDIGAQLYVDPRRRTAFQRIMRDNGRVEGFESQVRRRDGSIIWIRESARAVHDDTGALLFYEGTVQDITAAKSYQDQLEHQANHDQLTGLPNRNLLNDRLQQAINYARRKSFFAVVAFLDLDNFKYINDGLGHVAGDALLVTIAERLQGCLRGDDTVARYGGDEFVLVLGNHYEFGSIVQVLERIIAEVKKPVTVGDKELFTTCSIGLSVYPQDGEDAQSLIKHADAAMYLAKSSGRNNFQFFTRRLNTIATERVHLEAQLRRAIEREELRVFYQPKMNRHGHAVGVEALLRWQSDELGWVAPDKFIGVAEETGLIEPMTEFVLRQACRQAVAWSRQGLGDLGMAVNLSARCLGKPDMSSFIEQVLDETGLEPHRLELEITESMVIGNAERSIQLLHAIKALGVLLAVDDFGTGYSSLSYLQRLPVDILKIDRAFVSVIGEANDESPIARLIVLLGLSLNLRVVAEGVESAVQQQYLEALGCDEFQGFLHARPASAADIAPFLAAHAPTAKPPAAAGTAGTVTRLARATAHETERLSAAKPHLRLITS
jgi:diguanylate cyclase (GGDEF)-like protein/PAS domain S-box-containing protein